jgi:DNA-binding MarR family transcriptional regulator
MSEEKTSAAARAKARPSAAFAGLDQSCLQHVLGYQLAQAEIPTGKIFARSIGKPLGLRPVEFTILLLLAHNRDVTQKQLAQALAVTAPGMTVLLDRLAARGLVARERNAGDRRSQFVRLTEDGETLAQRAHEVSLSMEQELLRHLSAAEQAMLFELLFKVAKHRRA